MQTFEAATKEFLKSLDYIGVVDSATKAGLENAAVQLDKRFATSLLAEYNKTVRYIKSLNPETEAEEEDPLLSPK